MISKFIDIESLEGIEAWMHGGSSAYEFCCIKDREEMNKVENGINVDNS